VCLGLTGDRAIPRVRVSNLPAGLHRKVCYSHPVRSTTRTRRNTLVGSEVLVAAGSARKLNDQAFAHEVRAICNSQVCVRNEGSALEGVYIRKAAMMVSASL
jgi:hypothetical protein